MLFHGESAAALLRASTEALLDPQVLLEAVRDSSGRVVDFRYREVNQATCDYFGLARDDILGRGMVETLPGIREALLPTYTRTLESGEPVILNDFSYYNEMLLETRRYDIRATRATPNCITLTWRDVTERFLTAQRIAASEARYRRALVSAAVGMCLITPDGHFAEVNDAVCEFLGRDAQTLRQMTWRHLTAPAYIEADLENIGGILSGQIDTYRATRQYIHADGRLIWGDQSVGCLRNADGNVELFIVQISDLSPVERRLRERLEFETVLSRAIADGRLLVHAQPIVEARTGRVLEHELLVRMIADDGRVLAPAEFLPQARRFGMMPVIDRFMLARGIELAEAGRRVAINLSAYSINDPATVAGITEALRRAGDAAARVSFEITETAALESTDMAERFSTEMCRLGCRLSLDDFGTGFGAFTELRRMTLHALKIDRSFIADLLTNPQSESVVKAIVAVARQFGLLTTAEGVEDAATRDRLIELGVDQLQGYLTGAPAPVTGAPGRATDPPQTQRSRPLSRS